MPALEFLRQGIPPWPIGRFTFGGDQTGSPQLIEVRADLLGVDMLAAERGAGANTLAAYRRDLEDFSLFLKTAGRTIVKANTDDLRAYLGELSRRGFG